MNLFTFSCQGNLYYQKASPSNSGFSLTPRDGGPPGTAESLLTSATRTPHRRKSCYISLMRRQIALAGIGLFLGMGCGSDNQGPSVSQYAPADYQGFVLGRINLERSLDAGPVEVWDNQGNLIKAAQANSQGWFYYTGYLPHDFSVRARRGADTYEAEFHQGWKGGTLYVNAATTLASAYRRSHSGAGSEEAENKVRRFYGLKNTFPMSWFSVVRTRNFKTDQFFAGVRQAGGLNAYLNQLIPRLELADELSAKSLLTDLLSTASDAILDALVTDSAGAVVARMGDNFTTSGALNTIESDIVIVSQQVAALSEAFEDAAAYENLKSVIQPLADNASVIDLAMVNITDTTANFLTAHPAETDYNTPSSFPDIQSTIGQVQSLNLASLTSPIASNVTQTNSSGLYQLLVKEQMTEISQNYDVNFWNGYSWRKNFWTEQQLQLLGKFITSLQQSGYLSMEYGQLQTTRLADAMTQASSDINRLAADVQTAAQQVPDLMLSDDLILDMPSGVMWYSLVQDATSWADAQAFADQLEVGPYTDWEIPDDTRLDTLIRSRVGPATKAPLIDTNGTWDKVDANSTNWKDALTLLGFELNQIPNVDSNSGTNDLPGYESQSQGAFVENGFAYLWSVHTTGANHSSPTTRSEVITAPVIVYRPVVTAEESMDSGQFELAPLVDGMDQISPFIAAVPVDPSVSVDSGHTQLTARSNFQVLFPFPSSFVENYGMNGPGGSSFDITQRVVWSSSNPVAADVSNFVLPGSKSKGSGSISWHPPLDGTGLSAVTFTASLRGTTTTGTTQVTTQSIQVQPPAGLKPVLSQVYATPNNQVINVATAPGSLPITLLAYYQDGRVKDVSTDPATTWTLTDAATNATITSGPNGGFGAQGGTSLNVLYLTANLPDNLTYTASYHNNWGSASFTGKLQLLKAPPPLPTITNILPFRGPVTGGQSILIRGTGFTPGSFVTFNGAAATTLFVTTEELSVITPAGSVGSASVVVTSANGSSSTPAAYYYDP